ncbi:10276_t:CDS:2 [Gigaspora margarita]|uniref:10276_t:CDS:1 n=1 Tax=Gigaspora margarita TaxID=4874 RepID=A0ABN7VD27_GIGMA|nr:10276_t:CDS:2 [Gigaspora margarita]
MGQLKKHLLIRRINVQKVRSKRNNNKDDIPIIDDAYDLEDEEAVETVFEMLIKNAHNIGNKNKNSCWRYTGSSVRTRQQKLQENRINAIGSYRITEFFSKANSMNLNDNEIMDNLQSDYESESKSETEIMEESSQWEQKLQETEKRIQYLIDTSEISKTDKAKKCLEGDPLPLTQREKHPSKSLLHDEYVSLRIANYLQATKFQAIPLLDENWDGEKLLSQVKNAIRIFERTHPECIRIWAFDNATSHTVMAPDALVAARMNLHPSDFLNERGLIQQEIEKHGHKKYKSHRSIPRTELIKNSQ